MDSFCKIRDIYRAIIEFENSMIASHGMSLNEGMLLCCLSKKGCCKSTEIAESLNLTCSNTSKVIKSVEAKEFIKRDLGATDKRSMLFTLTPKGEQKLKEMEKSMVEMPALLKELIKSK